MRISTNKKALLVLLPALLIFLQACKKEVKGSDDYKVNPVLTLPPNAGKSKQKTDEQYIAILHANLFQLALSANQIFEISQCIQSIGDKEVAREVIISNFMNEGSVKMPTDQEMRADIETFVRETYNRFLVRNPTEAEITYFENYISANPNVTVELVYFSFAMSNEYLFY